MQISEASVHRLVGRERECAQLAALVSVAVDGAGGVVLVCGEAGVGKTAIADAALAGSPLLEVRAAASPIATPSLGPIVYAAHALRRELPEAFSDAAAKHPAFAHFIPELGEGNVTVDRAGLFRAAIGAFCTIARHRALALVLDDMQWADRATLELIGEMTHEARRAPLLIVVVHRSDGVARGHPIRLLRETLRRARILNEIVVEPLDRPDALQLVARLLGDDVPAEVQTAIVERSAGIPLFIEALVAALKSCGCFEPASLDVRTLPLPETVRDAILARVDALSTRERQAAEAAAVAGSAFPLALFLALNDGEDGVEALFESGLLIERAPRNVAFRTPLTSEAICAAIPWSRRRALHRRAAEVLSAAGGSVEQEAEHWQAAGEHDRARSAWLEAACRSRRLYAHNDAVQQLRRALDLWPIEHDSSERLAALDQLGDSAQLARRFADALRAWREVADSASARGDHPAAARAMRKIANVHELNCDWQRALETRQDAAAAFARGAQHAEAAAELHAAGARLRNAGQYSAALETLERAAAAAEAGGAADLAIKIAALTGNVHARSGRAPEGIAMARAALARALDENRPDLAGDSYLRLADAIQTTSDFVAAIDVFRAGIELCERNGLPVTTNVCLMCMSYALFRTGAWEEAGAAAQRVLKSSDSTPVATAGANAIQGLVYAARGELRRSRPFVVTAGALSRSAGAATVEFCARWGLALHESVAGNNPAAAEQCRDFLSRWRQTEEGTAATSVLRWASSCLAAEGDRDGVRACADALGEILTRLGHAETLSALAHVLGELALLDGDAARAAEQFSHATALLEDRGIPFERAHSQLRAAVAYAACGRVDDAVAWLRDCARGAERLGARPLADAVAKELRRLGQPLAGALGPRAGRRAERAGLTMRQVQILTEIAKGLTDKEVARALSLSPRTVEMHVARALAVLDCRSRTEAVRKVADLGMLRPRA
jgi:DNA-binding NarL/FixJ family response regulator/tetratricopeptide (TPR) repeat protein